MLIAQLREVLEHVTPARSLRALRAAESLGVEPMRRAAALITQCDAEETHRQRIADQLPRARGRKGSPDGWVDEVLARLPTAGGAQLAELEAQVVMPPPAEAAASTSATS